MQSLVRRLKRPLQILALLLAILWLAWLLLVPRLVRTRAVAALEKAGLDPVTMDLPEVGLFSAQMKYVMAGRQPGLTIGRVWVSYSPLELLRGKVKRVELQGVDLSMPLPASPRRTAPAAGASSAAAPRPPFERLTISDARLHLPTTRGVAILPLEVIADANPQHTVALNIKGKFAGADAFITATANAAFNRFDWQLRAEKIPASAIDPWTGELPLQAGDVDVVASGKLDTAGGTRIEVESLEAVAPRAVLTTASRTLWAGLRLKAAGTLLQTPAGWDIASAAGLHLQVENLSPLANLPPVTLWARFEAMRLRLGGGGWEWEGKGAGVGMSNTRVDLEPWRLERTATGLTGELRAGLKQVELRKNPTLERALPRLTPWNLSGKLQADAHLAWQDGKLSSGGHLHLWDTAMVNKDYELSVTGVESRVELTQLWPLRIAPSQTFSMGYAQIGKWELRNLAARFSAPGRGTLLIESGDIGWAGGELWCEPFELSMSDWVIRTTLSGRDLDLGKVVWVFSGEKAYAEGKARLQIPVTFKWPQIRLGEGYAEAAKGSILHLTAPAEQLGKWLVASDPRFATDPTQMRIRDRLMEALRDFRLERFRADLSREGQQLKTTISLEGAGDKGPNPQVVKLNITANDLDWLLSRYLATKR